MNELSKLLESEVADFFAGFGGPGEPDIQSGEAQQQLTERLLSVLALRERAEPDYYVVVTSAGVWQSFHKNRAAAEFIVSKPFHPGYSVLEIYTRKPAPVVPDEIPAGLAGIIISLCAYNVRDKELAQKIWNACRAAMLTQPTKANNVIGQYQGADGSLHNIVTLGRTAGKTEPVSQPYKLPDGWIKCGERMPEEGAEVYIFCDGEWVLEAQYRQGDFYDVVRDGSEVFETVSRCVSHWQPRPQRPAAPGKEG